MNGELAGFEQGCKTRCPGLLGALGRGYYEPRPLQPFFRTLLASDGQARREVFLLALREVLDAIQEEGATASALHGWQQAAAVAEELFRGASPAWRRS